MNRLIYRIEIVTVQLITPFQLLILLLQFFDSYFVSTRKFQLMQTRSTEILGILL